ncbi:MAG: aquaporin family protein [Deltaproteobacteria bacterium]|nr:aquaporin family protein [Deltaproteobacteria bacterium]
MGKEPTSMQKYLAELVGTFILVWIGPGAAVVAGLVGVKGLSDVLAIALAFGIAVAIAIYIVGKISGCHINPAVTIALAVRGRFPWKDVGPYIVFQCAGAVIASLLFVVCLGPKASSEFGLGATIVNSGAGVTIMMGMTGEIIGTFFLMLTIMGVAVDTRAPAGWAGWIIGMAVAGIIITLGPITGASINPARTFGPYIGNFFFGGPCPWDQFILVYCVGPIIGAVIAVFVYDAIANPKAVEETE